MTVRAIDINNDWDFGRGLSSYKREKEAVAQNIKTRLQSWVGDCFFDINAGIDWINLLDKGVNVQATLEEEILSLISNTDGVVGVVELNISLENREFTGSYSVDTTFGLINGGI